MTETNESSGVNLKKDVKFSIIIPAHNEEKYIRKCLDSIAKASEAYKEQTEVIVVLN
ncbi:glycosyltransferase, partial [Bacillus thuringiensis]